MRISERTRLRALVALAADAVAPAWPLARFVAVNPLAGFETMTFDDATRRAAELFRARVLPDTAIDAHEPAESDPHARARDLIAAIGVRDTLGDWCETLGWGDAVARVNERTSTWLGAYCDTGEATWTMPYRERGFFAAWKRLARHEGRRRAVDALPDRADDALLELLLDLDVPEERRLGYIQRHLAQSPGWSGYVKTAAESGEIAGLDLTALLAVRVWYERAEVSARARKHGAPFRFSALRDWLLERPERVPLGVHGLPRESDHLAALARLGRRERAYLDDVLARIAHAPPVPAAPPRAQFVFCIDARSEPLRRAIEAEGPYATIGFAGFFGVPIRYRAFDAAQSLAQAPVLVRPTRTIEERPDARTAAQLRRERAVENARNASLAGTLHHPIAAFAGVECVGPLAAVRAALATFFTRRAPAPIDDLPLVTDALQFDERVFFAEAALRMMGLTRDFAPLVVFCGHGGGTVNNAFASSLDCGACGGNRGAINARIAAAILNERRVRAALAERGIVIPSETRFVAAEHDTTRDLVRIIDGDVPDDVRAALASASASARVKRAVTLPAAPLGADDPFARASDWAQVRPEWGLARNAGFIVAPRSLTRGTDLDGRCFLHSYDPAADDDGRILEQILTAPLIVAQWINLQYFFATIDPERFGSGDKLLQQPVAGIGVVQGNGGDLRLNLPLQSTTYGETPYHEPLRLVAIVNAPTERIDRIIARQQVLQRLFHHRWVSLVAIDPDDGRIARFTDGTHWTTCTETIACTPNV